MNLSSQDREQVLALVAHNVTERILERIDLDELATIELSTAAQLLGLGAKAAARVLPVIEVGPRTRRVTVKAFKEFVNSRRKLPRSA